MEVCVLRQFAIDLKIQRLDARCSIMKKRFYLNLFIEDRFKVHTIAVIALISWFLILISFQTVRGRNCFAWRLN